MLINSSKYIILWSQVKLPSEYYWWQMPWNCYLLLHILYMVNVYFIHIYMINNKYMYKFTLSKSIWLKALKLLCISLHNINIYHILIVVWSLSMPTHSISPDHGYGAPDGTWFTILIYYFFRMKCISREWNKILTPQDFIPLMNEIWLHSLKIRIGSNKIYFVPSK